MAHTDMLDDLPDSFDVVVIGTGLAESILAAALSRIGRKVLHIDSSEYYSGSWATLHLSQIQQLAQEADSAPRTEEDGSCPHFQDCPFKASFSELSYQFHDESVSSGEESSPFVWNKDKIEQNGRKFNLDLSPKVLYSRGLLVELLISSDVAKYAEFKLVSRLLTYHDQTLKSVPFSRSDIFNNEDFTLREKRQLMKFIETVMSEEQVEALVAEDGEKNIIDFLSSRQLSNAMINGVILPVAMADNGTNVAQALKGVQRFVGSLGRFGNTPFLWPLYGIGEIPQCFCRLGAVFGCVYILNCKLRGLSIDETGVCDGIVVEDKRKIKCSYVITDASFLQSHLIDQDHSQRDHVSRAVLIMDSSVLPSDKEQLSVLWMPEDGVHAFEIGYSAGATPFPLYCLYLFTKKKKSPEEDLRGAVQKLIPIEAKCKILFSMYYASHCWSQVGLSASAPKNLHALCGPTMDLDCDLAVQQAQSLFQQLCPEEEFLPRPPNPDDIVMEQDETASPDSPVAMPNNTAAPLDTAVAPPDTAE